MNPRRLGLLYGTFCNVELAGNLISTFANREISVLCGHSVGEFPLSTMFLVCYPEMITEEYSFYFPPMFRFHQALILTDAGLFTLNYLAQPVDWNSSFNLARWLNSSGIQDAHCAGCCEFSYRERNRRSIEYFAESFGDSLNIGAIGV